MALAPIQGDDHLFELSDDGGTTWEKVVCVTESGFDISVQMNSKNTQCGPVIGLSKAQGEFPVTFVFNTTPGSGEISGEQILAWILGRTPLKMRQQNGSGGANLYIVADVYLTKMSGKSTVGDVMTIDCTLNSFGEIDNTP